MPPVEIVQVAPTMAELLAEIAALAADTSLPAGTSAEAATDLSARGFFVSGYSLDQYRQAAAHGRLAATVEDGHATGFLLTYGPTDPVDPGDHGSRFIRDRFGPATPIIKQIASGAAHAGKGHARLLYERFAATQNADVFAAIVKFPPNHGSEAFHRKLGFHECTVFDHPDGKPRGIWRWPLDRQPAGTA
jgi:predicted GNAT superfamily acetyltransferase